MNPTFFYLYMWMKVFAALQSLLRRKSHKSWRLLPLNVNNAKEIQSVEASDSSLSHQPFSKNRETALQTHTWLQKKANSRKVLKSVFFVEFFEKFYFDFYLLPCIDPIFKHKSRLTLFAQTWRRRKKQQRNEIALVEYGKICRKKTS